MKKIQLLSLQNNSLDRFCLLDFTHSQHIHLTIINDRRFEFSRSIPFESFDEASLEVMQSLRSACAKSVNKQCPPLFTIGDTSTYKALLASISEKFSQSVKELGVLNPSKITNNKTIFDINLNKALCPPQNELTRIMLILNVVVAVLLIGCIALGTAWKMNNQTITTLKKEIAQYGQ